MLFETTSEETAAREYGLFAPAALPCPATERPLKTEPWAYHDPDDAEGGYGDDFDDDFDEDFDEDFDDDDFDDDEDLDDEDLDEDDDDDFADDEDEEELIDDDDDL